MTPRTQTLHATSVAIEGRGLLIVGPSGSGKSALALQLMALGAVLIADDCTLIMAENDGLLVRRPQTLPALIEARGVGLLNAPVVPSAPLWLVVDLATTESERLPPRRHVTFLGIACDLVFGSRSDHFPASVVCYLRYGRHA